MTESQYAEMVSMLIKATQMRALSWSYNNVRDHYCAKLGDCQVCVSNAVDFHL